MIKFKFTYRDTEDFNKWLRFYPKQERQTPFRLELEQWGYFDPRPQIVTNVTSLIAIVVPFISLWLIPLSIIFMFVGWGKIFLSLPYDTGKSDECENPSYGFNTWADGHFVNELWVYWGKKRKHMDLPWHLSWYRTSLLLKDGTWEHEYRKSDKRFYDEKWNDKKWAETHPYVYTLKSGKTQNVTAKITVNEREWRRIIFYRLPIFRLIKKTIEVEFDHEVGERSGSWKGGVIGCGFDILKNETPYDALKRMETTREFR